MNSSSGEHVSGGALHLFLLGVVSVLAALLVFCAATAEALVINKDYALQAGFGLRGSNGYSVSVTGDGRQVTLTAGGFTGAATYMVPGRVSTRGVWARFGNRGRIAVEFRPSGSLTRRVPPDRCTGKPRVTKFGTFVGTIRFAGEHGFTRVDVKRARGSVHAPRQWRCRPRHGRGGGPPCRSEPSGPEESIVLDAESQRQGRGFSAIGTPSPEESGATVFFGSSFERRGHMRVMRFLFVEGPERAFTYDSGLATATTAPPLPFTGSATFQRNPDRSTSWKGTLRVSLPGAPHLALTGPAFDARLVRPVPEGISTICVGSFAATRAGNRLIGHLAKIERFFDLPGLAGLE